MTMMVAQTGTLGRLGDASLQGVIWYHEGTRPPNLVVYEQMDLPTTSSIDVVV
jgi:hypothetical protein